MLTIEELKNLPDGEYIWLVEISGMYVRKVGCTKEYIVVDAMPVFDEFKFTDYGTKWLAYRNKEEAEGQSITLPYLLCTSSKFACVIWRDTDGKVHKTYTMPIDEAKGVLKEKERLCHTNE